MSLLDMAAKLMGAAGGKTEIFNQVNEMLNQHGGINGLVEKFQKNGLGETVNSWISTGKNLPIDATQLQAALGSDTIKNLAAKIGVNPETAASQLSALLPNLIDQLTPNGSVPAGGLSKDQILSAGAELLKKKLFS
jgi:uncharacterized protein YidB (DUF937 family)